jgi:hypothetical protein
LVELKQTTKIYHFVLVAYTRRTFRWSIKLPLNEVSLYILKIFQKHIDIICLA